MGVILTEVASWLTAAMLAAAMLVGWHAGRWWGRRLAQENREGVAGTFKDASLALLGLLLAFTFSMSLGKQDQRRQMVVTDSNAIGDFYTCVSLLKEPVRGKLQAVVRRYAEQRLALASPLTNEAALEEKLDEIQAMHGQIQWLVDPRIGGPTPFVLWQGLSST